MSSWKELKLNDSPVELKSLYISGDPTGNLPALVINGSGGEASYIRFLNLPISDPGVPGALYKKPNTINSHQSPIMISNG